MVFSYENSNVKNYMVNVISRMNDEELENTIYDYIDENSNISNLKVNNINEFCIFYMSLTESINRINMDLDLIDIYEDLRNFSVNRRYSNKKALSFVLFLNNMLYNSDINLHNLEIKDKELYGELINLLERN